MRARLVAVILAVLVMTVAAAGCGGGGTVSATPETVEGPLPTTTTTETTPASQQKGNVAAGKEVFTGSAGCTGCHTLADAGSTGTVGPNLDEAKPGYDLVIDRVTNGQGAMPSFKGTLSEEQIQDVAKYVSTVAGK
jgi:cytochrome c6